MTPTKQIGRLFAFEGPDDVGKSTILRAANEILRSRGHEVKEGAFPGNDPSSLGRLVYELHHAPQRFGISQVANSSLQLMHVAAHLDAIEGWIISARNQGKMILLDRFWWSTAAYAAAAAIPDHMIEKILAPELAYWRQQPPDAVFLLSRGRIGGASPPHRSHNSLSTVYDRLATEESDKTRVIRIVNNGTIEQAALEVATHIGSLCDP